MKHFPIRTETTGSVTTYFALCGLQSEDKKLFVDPRQYKVGQVTCEDCLNYDREPSGWLRVNHVILEEGE